MTDLTCGYPFILVSTCLACPEQYDVIYSKGKYRMVVAYLRLRHCYFYASCPGVEGKIVYEAEMEESDGCFSDRERDIHIPAAMHKIHEWITENNLL